MKSGARGRVIIPKKIRDRYKLGAGVEIAFQIVDGSIVLKKLHKRPSRRRFKASS
ncbi:MAG: AbrB/MazE/SpoVT family DNA-binding domain-containing protein [Bryobacteraceae bacterium]